MNPRREEEGRLRGGGFLRRPSFWVFCVSGGLASAVAGAQLVHFFRGFHALAEQGSAAPLSLAARLSLLGGLPAAVVAWRWLGRGDARRASLLLVAPPLLAAVLSAPNELGFLRIAAEVGAPLAACGAWAALSQPRRSVPLAAAIATCFVLLVVLGNSLGFFERRLVAAAGRGDVGAVRLHLAAGLDVEARRAGGASPLMAAVEAGDAEMVRLLLDRGALPLRADASGDSPMLRSIERGSTEITVLLLGPPASSPETQDHSREGSSALPV